jgi:hypothetical protein
MYQRGPCDWYRSTFSSFSKCATVAGRYIAGTDVQVWKEIGCSFLPCTRIGCYCCLPSIHAPGMPLPIMQDGLKLHAPEVLGWDLSPLHLPGSDHTEHQNGTPRCRTKKKSLKARKEKQWGIRALDSTRPCPPLTTRERLSKSLSTDRRTFTLSGVVDFEQGQSATGTRGEDGCKIAGMRS